MIITRYKYKNLSEGTKATLSCSQEDIVNRVGVMNLQEEKSLMEQAGRTFQDYVSRVYSKVIGKGEGQILENGLNTSQFKETLDVIDAQRELAKEMNKNKIKSEEIETEINTIEKELDDLNNKQIQSKEKSIDQKKE